jgi:glycosyltransferase involved in cell wall biosynthesis
MKMAEISIIVPVYNVERYLERCVKSILNQSFSDFELILVDDGSPDNCPQMCDEWAEADARIKVIHKENGGLSSARNAGLEIAQGNYIGFVDSDDWIEPDMYAYLYELIQRYKADFAAIDMLITKEETEPVEQPRVKERECNQNELYEIFFRVSQTELHYCVCDKLIDRRVIRDVRFWEGMRFEDIDFNFKLLKNTAKGVYSNQIKYHYYYNEDGITRNKVVPEDLQLLVIWENISKNCQQDMETYSYYAKMNYERAYMGLLGKYAKFGVSEQFETWRDTKKQLLCNLRKYKMDLLKWKMPFSRKLLLLVMTVSPDIVAVLFRVKGKIT